jgi:hypothetical protein
MITIVSGLPRSGTSLMMQMLAAGGMAVLADGERRPDADNPRGYVEWERIKQLPNEPGCIAEAEGKAVKVISRLLLSLPEGHDYRVIFMQRPLAEILASQNEMIRRRGTVVPGASAAIMSAAMESHLREVEAWLGSRVEVKTFRLPYPLVLRESKRVAEELAAFLDISLDVDAMAGQVDPALYRQRAT